MLPPQVEPTARLLLRARKGSRHHRNDSSLTPENSLLHLQSNCRSAATVVTTTSPQLLVQQLLDATAARHSPDCGLAEEEEAVILEALGDGASVMLPEGEIELLIVELLELREAVGDAALCASSAERRYGVLLQQRVISALATRVFEPRATDTKDSSASAVKEACAPLLTLCVKPSPLARELAFLLMRELASAVAVAATTSPHVGWAESLARIENELFVCFADMLVKAAAVAGSTPTPAVSREADGAWLLQVTTSLSVLLTHTGGCGYRLDRVAKLDTQSLVFLTRRALRLPVSSGVETNVQETLLETMLCAVYMFHHRPLGSCGARKSQVDTPEVASSGVALADVDRFGGLDLLLAIFFSTLSDRVRRLLFVVFFDLSLEQLRRAKSRDADDAWASYESLLHCLQDADMATLIAATPLSFAGGPAETSAFTRTVHASVENELLERHITAWWVALRGLLQVDEYFMHSASLSNAIKLVATSSASSQPQQSQESVAEAIAAKTRQLILTSPRLEDRFKGERWLAELLTYGLPSSGRGEEGVPHGSEKLLIDDSSNGRTGGGGGDQFEQSFCFDEHAEFRLCARATLWELARSDSESARAAFACVLRLFTRRRLRLGTATDAETASLIEEMNQCLPALVDHDEQSAGVLTTVIDALLTLVANLHEDVPYLDRQRQKYDADSCDAPQELVGSLVGSESLAARILQGEISLSRARASLLSVEFLFYALETLKAATACDSAPSLLGDYSAATALLVVHTLDDASSTDPQDHSVTIRRLASFLNASDARVALIVAPTLVSLLKRAYGERHYLTAVRELHAAAVASDNDEILANSVAHTRAVLHWFAGAGPQLTP